MKPSIGRGTNLTHRHDPVSVDGSYSNITGQKFQDFTKMDIIITIAAYVITILITYFGLTGLLVGIGGMFGGMIGALGVSCLVWLLVNILWTSLEGATIPVAALFVAFISLFFLPDYKNLNQGARNNVSAEQWGIILISIYIMLNSSPIRWV